MELYKEILIQCLGKEDIHITFPNLEIDPAKIVELTCYNALREIKFIIEDDRLEDEECFHRIEEIVSLLEEIGSGGGNRHDFG